MGPSSPAVQFVYHGQAGPGFLLRCQVFLASELVYRSTFDFWTRRLSVIFIWTALRASKVFSCLSKVEIFQGVSPTSIAFVCNVFLKSSCVGQCNIGWKASSIPPQSSHISVSDLRNLKR